MSNLAINIKRDPKAFYDYSFFKLGEFDAPAQIDFVLKATGKSKLTYVGHSQGTSQMYSALAENYGGLRDKLNLFVALAPIVNLHDTTNSMLLSASAHWQGLLSTSHHLGVYALRTQNQSSKMAGFCKYFAWICSGIGSWFKPSPWNVDAATQYLIKRPQSSASLGQVAHYGQIIKSTVYKQYDYGRGAINEAIYGTVVPPLIPLSSIEDVPIAMFLGQYDDLAVATDGAVCYKTVKTSFYYKVWPDMDHMSFMIGKNMDYFADVIKLVGKYNGHGEEPLSTANEENQYLY